jgi:hypothetical protein
MSRIAELFHGIERVLRRDSWFNAATGQGAGGEKLQSMRPGVPKISRQTLVDLYTYDHLAKRIVDEKVNEAFREGIIFQPKDGDRTEMLDRWRELDRKYKVLKQVQTALKWARRDGGCLLVKVPAVRKEALMDTFARPAKEGQEIACLVPWAAFHAQPYSYYDDPKNDGAKLGRPNFYKGMFDLSPDIRSSGELRLQIEKMHESHCYRIEGIDNVSSHAVGGNGYSAYQQLQCSDGFGSQNFFGNQNIESFGWGVSVLSSVFSELQAFRTTSSSVNALMADLSQAVYALKDLHSVLASEDTGNQLQARFSLIDRFRSSSNAIILDADHETFTRTATPMTDVPAVLTIKMLELTAAAEMPVTRLFGEKPAGLSTSNEIDMTIWYDRTKVYQREEVEPVIIEVISWLDPSFPEFDIYWPDLRQLSAKDKAAAIQAVAQADAIYLQQGVFSPGEIALIRAEHDGTLRPPAVDAEQLRLLAEEVAETDREEMLKSEGGEDDFTEQPKSTNSNAGEISPKPESPDAPNVGA